MKIKILAFGKLKTPGLSDARDYYTKLLKPWADLEEIELKPLNLPDKSKETAILLREIEKFSTPCRVILMSEDGKSLSSREWSDKIAAWQGESVKTLVFCVGASLGFEESFRKKSDLLLSFGKQTLSHELARVVLTEQIYRAFSILRGHPYHND